jgi:phosphoglycerate dehydrogenase-like enzyme
MRVLGVDARQTEPPAGMERLAGADELDRLLPEADWVIMTIPHTPETEGLMRLERLRLMKRSRVPDQHRQGDDRKADGP